MMFVPLRGGVSAIVSLTAALVAFVAFGIPGPLNANVALADGALVAVPFVAVGTKVPPIPPSVMLPLVEGALVAPTTVGAAVSVVTLAVIVPLAEGAIVAPGSVTLPLVDGALVAPGVVGVAVITLLLVITVPSIVPLAEGALVAPGTVGAVVPISVWFAGVEPAIVPFAEGALVAPGTVGAVVAVVSLDNVVPLAEGALVPPGAVGVSVSVVPFIDTMVGTIVPFIDTAILGGLVAPTTVGDIVAFWPVALGDNVVAFVGKLGAVVWFVADPIRLGAEVALAPGSSCTTVGGFVWFTMGTEVSFITGSTCAVGVRVSFPAVATVGDIVVFPVELEGAKVALLIETTVGTDVSFVPIIATEGARVEVFMPTTVGDMV